MKLSHLSWEAVDKKLSLSELWKKFNNLKLEFQKYKDLEELFLYSDNLSVDFKKVYYLSLIW